MTLDKLDKFIGLVIARGILGQRDFSAISLWKLTWGFSMFNNTLSRQRFKEMIHSNVSTGRVAGAKGRCMTSFAGLLCFGTLLLRTIRRYVAGPYITSDKQLLPCKAKCKFTQYMPNKADNFGIKFWMAIDAETKHLFYSFPKLGKDENWDTSVSLPK